MLLLALGVGTGLACLAGARRTASSFDRIAAATSYPDIVTSHGEPPARAEEIVAGFEGVARSSIQVGFAGFIEGLDPTLVKYFMASWREPFTHLRPTVTEGRHPDPARADEVLVVGKGVTRGGIRPGDELTLQLFRSDFSGSESVTVTVTGTSSVGAGEVVTDAGQDRSAILFTPAFAARHAEGLMAWSSTTLRVDAGSSVD